MQTAEEDKKVYRFFSGVDALQKAITIKSVINMKFEGAIQWKSLALRFWCIRGLLQAI